MNDKIIFYLYYCINSAKNERSNDALYFTASSHFHTHKSIHSYARSGRSSVSHYYECFEWCLVTSINKSHVLTACAHKNCDINAQLFINIWLLISCEMGIFAIMVIKETWLS